MGRSRNPLKRRERPPAHARRAASAAHAAALAEGKSEEEAAAAAAAALEHAKEFGAPGKPKTAAAEAGAEGEDSAAKSTDAKGKGWGSDCCAVALLIKAQCACRQSGRFEGGRR
eukprot:TRINITY_DN35004_c0_g1_i2.p3 TRINITY_DN35004_c0_g1~~TRINITY_DN35004_c0_g1_i2.p3  ORF type:complete len:114 (-),score=36.51 TRINITY_DN35004_c0_g1_i2:396-737(-)